MSVVGSMADWREEAKALGRFANALTPDARSGRDPAAAAPLADSLVNRAVLAVQNGEGPSELNRRLRLLAVFIRLHRRHVRMQNLDDDMVEGAFVRESALVERVIGSMALDQREALLLVVLERLSHAEAAAVLEISLAALIDRLARARAALSRTTALPVDGIARSKKSAAHLRLIK
jgi:RNA polymerase sigma-70 factor, ECF subfamily